MSNPRAGDAIMIRGRVVEHFGEDLMVRFDAPGLVNRFLISANDVVVDREEMPLWGRNRIILRAAYRPKPAPDRIDYA